MKLNKLFYSRISIVLYIITAYYLYNLQYVVYAQTIDFMFSFALIYPPLALFLNKMGKDVPHNEVSGIGKIFAIGVTILGLILFLRDRYNFIAYVMVAISLFCCAVEFIADEKATNVFTHPRFIASAFAATLLATFFFVYIIKPVNVEEARGKVLESGYTNAEFFAITSKNDDTGFYIAEDIGTEALIKKPGCYIFRAEKDNEPYCIMVNVRDGSFALEEQFDTSTYISKTR